MTLNTENKNFQKDAVAILRALQTVKTQVILNAGELAAEEGVKVNSIVKRFGEIRKRYNLNIATTAAGYTGDKAPVQSRKKVSVKAEDLGKAMKRKARVLEESIDGTESDQSDTSAPPRKSPRVPKPTKREYCSDFDDSNVDAEEESKPSPAKKRSVLSDTTSEED